MALISILQQLYSKALSYIFHGVSCFYKGFFEDPRFDKTFNLLVDLRQTESTERSPAALRKFADFSLNFYGRSPVRTKIAVVAPKDLSFGLARMYEAYSDNVPSDFVVFRAVDAALAWLGLPEDFL